ncbi:hypothetical protein BaRGS_00000094 [Batillaria attramentaria]|uniref:Uncharacterized protein n=1 Tax=Batillaria attramentaria TaxID=370345 RepID=A0ABD0MAT4_9CAEN
MTTRELYFVRSFKVLHFVVVHHVGVVSTSAIISVLSEKPEIQLCFAVVVLQRQEMRQCQQKLERSCGCRLLGCYQSSARDQRIVGLPLFFSQTGGPCRQQVEFMWMSCPPWPSSFLF